MVVETLMAKLVESTESDKFELTALMPGFWSNSKLPMVMLVIDNALAEKLTSELLDMVRNAAFKFEFFDWLQMVY